MSTFKKFGGMQHRDQLFLIRSTIPHMLCTKERTKGENKINNFNFHKLRTVQYSTGKYI